MERQGRLRPQEKCVICGAAGAEFHVARLCSKKSSQGTENKKQTRVGTCVVDQNSSEAVRIEHVVAQQPTEMENEA